MWTVLVLTFAALAAPSLQWDTNCGVSKFPDAGIDQMFDEAYIVNGWDSRPHEFPWQLSLRRQNSHMCGAVLITPRYAITAAHCVEGENEANLRIVVGDHMRTTTDEADRKVVNVELYVAHPDYDATGEIENDVATLRLSEDVVLGENIVPACKPSGSYEGSTGTTSGWGRLGDSQPLADTLQYANNPLMNHQECHACFPNPTDILDGMLCFGICGQNTQSTCNGDSGGPLVVKGSDNKFDIVGLTSWGMGGCLSTLPPVFTNVSFFTEWIDEAMQVTPLTKLY